MQSPSPFTELAIARRVASSDAGASAGRWACQTLRPDK